VIEALEKAKRDFSLLFLVLIVSLGVSPAMISDSLSTLFFSHFSASFTYIIKIFELLIGILWLVLTIKVTFEALKIQRKYTYLFFTRKCEKLFSKDRVKSEIFRFIRDLIALYRGYYNEIRVVSLLAILIGFSMMVSVIYMSLYGISSLEESLFRFSVAALTLLVPATIFVYVSKNWGRKLLKIREEEEKFREFLGESIEA